MKDIWISVIVPAFNAERYLDKCITSLVNQEIFDNMEILIINDGSTDKTGIIADTYSKRYGNIKVFHIDNAGVSNARNLGIEKAQGLYVTFVDADDWVESQYYKNVYYWGTREDVDIIASGLVFENKAEVIASKSVTNVCKILDKETSIKGFLYGNIDVHVCNKVFRNDLLKKNRFDISLKIAEDRLFLFECLLGVKKMLLIPQNYYHYYQNNNSVMNQGFSEKNWDSILAVEKIVDMTKCFIPELLPYAECMCIADKCRILGELSDKKVRGVYLREYRKLKRDIRKFSMIKSIKFSSKKHVVALGLAKSFPKLYNKLRSNAKLKFG